METSRLEPEITICKIAVLPIKLCPLFIIYYPRNDLNVHDITSAKLKFALSTNSSTRIFNINIAKLPIDYILRRE